MVALQASVICDNPNKSCPRKVGVCLWITLRKPCGLRYWANDHEMNSHKNTEFPLIFRRFAVQHAAPGAEKQSPSFDILEWQPDIIFRYGATTCFGAHEVIQLGLLQTLAEWIGVREAVQH